MISIEPAITLFQQARHCELNNILGDYVECGVWKGGAGGLMTLANLKYGKEKRHIHLFDAFDDICEPDPEVDGVYAVRQVSRLANIDESELAGRLKPVRGVYDSHGGHGTVEIVKALLEEKIGYDPSFIHYHQGWFQDTLPKVHQKISKIAILRLDGDLYASTKVCLDYLVDKVVNGGFIIIDDYGAYEGCKKAVDEFRNRHGIKAYLHHVNQDCRYWIME